MGFSAQHIRDARNHLRKSDPVMQRIIKQVGPFTAKLKRDRFGTLSASIVSQQISGKAARSIWAKLEALVEPQGVCPEALAPLGVDQLRGVGISRQKAGYMIDLAQKSLDGTVNLSQIGRKSDEDVIIELTQIKGIGRWTAQMFLIFSLGRLDVFPVDDLGVKSAVKTQYRLRDLPTAKKIHQIAQPWQPFRSVATWYLWRSLDV